MDFDFPAVIEGQQSRRFQSSWFVKYEWLTYSRSQNAGYCAFCILFPPNNTVKRGGNVSLGVLVATGLARYKKALDVMNNHAKCVYHKNACMKLEFYGSCHRKTRKNQRTSR